MGRPAVKKERRETLVAAAETVIAARGLADVTLRDVAKEAGMTSSALLYYYPAMKTLLDDVQARAVTRFCTMRGAAVAGIDDPRRRLGIMIETGLPETNDDHLCRLLYELGAYSRTDAGYAARHIALFERQVAIYTAILESGAATGHFTLTDKSDTIARSLVVLEDGLGLHLVNVVPAVDRPTALNILRSYAQAAVGCRLD